MATINKASASIILAALSTAAAALGFVVSTLIARQYTPEEYGQIFYLVSLSTAIASVTAIGLPYSINRLILRTESQNAVRELYGKVLIYSCLTGIAAFILLYSLSRLQIWVPDSYSRHNIAILLVAAIGATLNIFIETTAPASTKIAALGFARLAPKLLLSILLGIMTATGLLAGLGIELILAMYFGVHALTSLLGVLALRPEVRHSHETSKKIWKENRINGVMIYAGSIITTLSGALAVFMLGALGSNMRDVALLSMAMNLCLPISIAVSSIGVVTYRQISLTNTGPWTTIFGAIATAVFLTSVVIWLGPVLVELIWPKEYSGVSGVLMIIAPATGMYAIADVLSRILLGHGRAKTLSTGSLLVAASLLSLTAVLVPLYSAEGAAYARLIAGFTYLGAMATGVMLLFSKPT